MAPDLALLLSSAWVGFSLALIVVSFIRLIKVREVAGPQPFPFLTRFLLFAFVGIGVFGYAGIIGNFATNRDLLAIVLLVGMAAGAFVSYLLVPRAWRKRDS